MQAHPVSGRSAQPGAARRRGSSSASTSPAPRGKFAEVFNIQHLTGPRIDKVSRVCISTVQRMYSILHGSDIDAEIDARSLYELQAPRRADRVQPRRAARNLRLHRGRRVPPLDLRRLAPGARVLRRLHYRPERDAEPAGSRLLRTEPGDGVHPRSGCRRQSQRRLQGLPHPDPDHFAGSKIESGLMAGLPTELNSRDPLRTAEDDIPYTREGSGSLGVAIDQIRTIVRASETSSLPSIFARPRASRRGRWCPRR